MKLFTIVDNVEDNVVMADDEMVVKGVVAFTVSSYWLKLTHGEALLSVVLRRFCRKYATKDPAASPNM